MQSNALFDALLSQPAAFLLALFVNLFLLADSLSRIGQFRWAFASIAYASIILWYFVDPIYRPADYVHIQASEFSEAYTQVLLFLIAFRLFMTLIAPDTPSSILRTFDPRVISDPRFVTILVVSWLTLFIFGISRVRFDAVTALYPLRGRADWGSQLFMRPQIGGSTDFLISACDYLYLFICSLFGVVFVGTRNPRIRVLMFGMIVLTWPMFVLCGARSRFLAVVVPSILAVLLLKRWTRLQQLVFVAVSWFVINSLMLIIIQQRNDGFEGWLRGDEIVKERQSKTKHLGLNMPEELVYINRYQADGRHPIEWGGNYFANAVNVVPRGLWPNKPFPGYEFAKLRVGLYRGRLAATISHGVIGQGVTNFGKWLGPIVPALLLTLMCSWLCHFMQHGVRILRICIVLSFLGQLPGMGRDLSMQLLWPTIFGAIGVLSFEAYLKKRSATRNRTASGKTVLIGSPRH